MSDGVICSFAKPLNQGNHLLDLRPCNIAALFFSESLKQRVMLLASFFHCTVHFKAQRSKGGAFKGRKMLFYNSLIEKTWGFSFSRREGLQLCGFKIRKNMREHVKEIFQMFVHMYLSGL